MVPIITVSEPPTEETCSRKLNITAKVETGEKLHEVGRFYSTNESTLCNLVKCKDAIKNAVPE
ncbi:hypothetical protein E2C01_039158 [Portunus trituberculatus]|uniref:Uncharacterized protein n=1 Tax=Portunus trituberculatus TaxID=210409 RepID=A0A5B7FJW6_PORTR|nr:hypothetical protein [Portunus trituberculatus]